MKQVKGILKIIVVTALAAGTVILVVLLSGGNSGGPKDTYRSPTLFAMDTTLQISIQGQGRELSEANVEECVALTEEIESITSRFVPDSDVSLINANAGNTPVEVHPETMEILQRSLEFSRLSDGAFDVTVAPIAELWGFYDREYQVPKPEEVEAARSLVDYRKVLIDEANDTVMLAEPGMQIDLGGVAKGYAVGAMCDMLKGRGVNSALVNFGGTVGAVGRRSDGEPWVIGIRDPRGEACDLLGKLKLEDSYVSSSGDYERFFTRDGTRYCHLFDPRTGYQSRGVESDTVAGSDPMNADILSTAVFVLGKDKGFALVGGQDGYEALMVERDGSVVMTPGMKERYVIEIKNGVK
ncbi:MAG: FAD:protein FMN transferase [Actinobacteria bacterium]|nr:FAD:protein FMN transferase [Actinomycetota bacterium]MCG2818958.1 FAD:protein FMN transferase [Actinomycetes bacterium]MBU4178349.1 FAD:protein FMN transferase [Actinomycetota bacterium]MBU4219519.1 FAD:protein FMN transferase [Actinomycetota bacterium]MBU4359121.1 FAD:protein FMN transferase [Actinomycetota bacterium]